ncbi:hypothetical protein [Methylobacterium sp. Leaf94]|uniref:hypothetical protein n=1 Tax=Methylobacterium sp. Leaf94 TaxID=1736250 RepID=UPI000B27FEDE|nr:hypothetical protein [Methylobacterium sp. Leaf94]
MTATIAPLPPHLDPERLAAEHAAYVEAMLAELLAEPIVDREPSVDTPRTD